MENNSIVKTSEIIVRVGLDQDRVPTSIEWRASDMHPEGVLEACKAMVVALFDKNQRETLRIDLWTKEMELQEMDRFVFQILRSLGQTYLRATNNTELAEDMARFAQYFGEKTAIIPPEKQPE